MGKTAKKPRLTPKFITKKHVAAIVRTILDTFMFKGDSGENDIDEILKRPMLKRNACHIVVLLPSVENARPDYPNYPNYPAEPVLFYEVSAGNEKEWSADYKNIARCKAQQLWRNQNTDGNTDVMAHLLFPDDTIFWGGVKRHGIVVACSGVQPWFDQMISGMIADAIKALGRETFERWKERSPNTFFVD